MRGAVFRGTDSSNLLGTGLGRKLQQRLFLKALEQCCSLSNAQHLTGQGLTDGRPGPWDLTVRRQVRDHLVQPFLSLRYLFIFIYLFF